MELTDEQKRAISMQMHGRIRGNLERMRRDREKMRGLTLVMPTEGGTRIFKQSYLDEQFRRRSHRWFQMQARGLCN